MDPEKGEETRMENTGARFAEESKSLGETATRTSYAASHLGDEHRIETAKAERRLLRKLDFVILPLAVLLYLAAYLDRGNLGNAKLQGIEKEILKNDDSKYSLALSFFFISYITFSIPGTLLAKAFDPSRSIAAGALIWSIAATCQAAVTSPGGLYACRFFVGVGEALFGQAIALYLSYHYRKNELAKRVGLFISAGSLAGAFGGLISYGVSSITHPKIDKWRILFLIEGCPSVLLAIVVFFCLPGRPQTTKFFNESERTLALTRLNMDSLAEGENGIDWKGVKRAFVDWKTYVIAIMYSCMNLGLGSVGGFLPTIIQGLGYTEAKAQLFTVPPYAVSLVFMLLITTYSDRALTRGIPVAIVFIIGAVGWAILMGVSPVKASHAMLSVRYFGCFCVVTAGYSAIPLIIAWQAVNQGAAQSQRAVSLGMLNTVGQCLSIAASYLFPKSEGPRFTKGASINLAFQCLGLAIALSMSAYFRWENRRRDKAEGGAPPAGEVLDVIEKFDFAPGFRYVP